MTEILLFNYWEHMKAEKDLARIYPPEHPQRKILLEALNKMVNSEQNPERSVATGDAQRTEP